MGALGEAALAVRLIEEEIAVVLLGELANLAPRAFVKRLLAMSEDGAEVLVRNGNRLARRALRE